MAEAALTLDRDGAELHRAALTFPELHALGELGESLTEGTAGERLFDKSAANNWPLGWHQDRKICVNARAEVPGFGPFTVKQGILHVHPPAAVIAGMVTLRAHLDPVDAAKRPRRRRVLQVDFAASDLPAPLDWLGI